MVTAAKLLEMIAVMMVPPAALRRHRERGGESPPPSSSCLAFSLDGRRVPPLVHWFLASRRAESPSEIGSFSLFLSVFRDSVFWPNTVS